MSTSTDAPTATASKPLVIVRTFNAPVEQVWRAWSEPEQAQKWWGPKDYSCAKAEIDFRVGGKNLFGMKGPDGNVIYSTGTYKEIVPMSKIVTTDSFADEHGNVVSSESYGMSGFPAELLVTIELEDLGDKTRMTLTHEGLPSGEISEMTNAGWNEMFDKLDSSVED